MKTSDMDSAGDNTALLDAIPPCERDGAMSNPKNPPAALCTPAPGEPLTRPGYHLVAIARGELGELSKIQEELDELRDAVAQGSRIMAAVELADLLGAVQAFMDRHLPGMTMQDLQTFSAITRRAFENGHRSSR